MGELVAFKQSAMPNRRIAKTGETAEILFFTGVRYVPIQEQETLLKQIGLQSRRQTADRLRQEKPSH
ncbi:MAG: hypothetical protein ACLQIQ_01110 [Beijerinckiaceae bacterium]